MVEGGGGGAPAAVAARLSLDGDALRRADRLAELAGNAPLLAVGIAAQRVLAAEARAERPLLVGVVQRHLGLEEVAQSQRHALYEPAEQEAAQVAVDAAHRSDSSRHMCGNRSMATSPPAVHTSQKARKRGGWEK